MDPTPQTNAAETFDPLRPLLIRVAYRMLGSRADAEDIVQDAFIRWLGTDRETIREPEAFLRRVVMRLCLDFLKSARHQRETYVGTWLPEPIVESDDGEEDNVTLPLLLALERLSPLERAAFLLHDVFGVSFEEIAQTIEREPAACRQLASRARNQVRAERPRFQVSKERGLEIAEAFFAASRNGDMQTLRSLLASDVAVYADGGGKRPAAMEPIMGIENVMRVQEALAQLFAQHPSKIVQYGFINGLPGFVTVEPDNELQTTGLQIEDGKVVAIYVMRNPDKLRRLVPCRCGTSAAVAGVHRPSGPDRRYWAAEPQVPVFTVRSTYCEKLFGPRPSARCTPLATWVFRPSRTVVNR
jgi:RNA polymerase sigma-70 factor (ECF subfamily)